MTSALFAQPSISREKGPDGSLLLRSTHPLSESPPSVMHSFRQWAQQDPDRVLVGERDTDDGWHEVTYGEALAATRSIGQALLDLGLGPDLPLLMLSGNGVAHMLTAMG